MSKDVGQLHYSGLQISGGPPVPPPKPGSKGAGGAGGAGGLSEGEQGKGGTGEGASEWTPLKGWYNVSSILKILYI